MAMPVVTVASGGMAVIDVTGTTPGIGKAVTEAINGKGTAVTKVAKGGMAVTYIVIATNGDKHPK